MEANWVFDNSEGSIINDTRTMIRTYDSYLLIQPPYGKYMMMNTNKNQ